MGKRIYGVESQSFIDSILHERWSRKFGIFQNLYWELLYMKPNKTCMCKMNKSICNFQFAIDFALSLLARWFFYILQSRFREKCKFKYELICIWLWQHCVYFLNITNQLWIAINLHHTISFTHEICRFISQKRCLWKPLYITLQ